MSRQTAIEIFLAGVESVKPDTLIRDIVSIDENSLRIKELTIDLTKVRNLFVVGSGKASALMAKELESILGNRISGGHVITKYHHSVPLEYIEVTEAGHPVPDENGVEGTKKILSIAERAGEGDVIVCLISGGGSALMTDLPDGIGLNDLKTLNDLLLKCGANINEMNCIRKHLSGIKGGFLSKCAWPARVISLILSDVVGDPLDVIASGPTAPDPTTFSDALLILNKYNIEDKIPPEILRLLTEGSNNRLAKTPKPGDRIFLNTANLLVGTNHRSLQKAKEMAEAKGYETEIVTDSLQGDVHDVAKYISGMAKSAKQLISNEKICLLFGGEPTLKVTADGSGGRNQHLALIVAAHLKDSPGITFLSGGTDGTDGPTDAAGAVVDSKTWINARDLDLDIDQYLQRFDSYNFFKREGGLIVTGPTQTNVMDIMLVLIE